MLARRPFCGGGHRGTGRRGGRHYAGFRDAWAAAHGFPNRL